MKINGKKKDSDFIWMIDQNQSKNVRLANFRWILTNSAVNENRNATDETCRRMPTDNQEKMITLI
jgi:hypothetical protein